MRCVVRAPSFGGLRQAAPGEPDHDQQQHREQEEEPEPEQPHRPRHVQLAVAVGGPRRPRLLDLGPVSILTGTAVDDFLLLRSAPAFAPR